MTTAPINSATREEWLIRRMSFVGGSEIAALFGVSARQSAFRLWAEKSGFISPVNLADDPFVKRGRRLEQFVADDYAESTGHDVVNLGEFATFIDEREPHLAATLDRRIDNAGERGPGALECKTAHAFLKHAWEDGAPLPYQLQLQAQLACTGWKWGVLACLIAGDDFRYFEYERHDELIALMREKVAAFWLCVEKGDPPEIDAHDGTASAIKSMFPEPAFPAAELPPEALVLDLTLEQAKSEIKRWSKVRDEADAKLRYLIGHHEAGRVPGTSVTYTAKTVKRAGYSVESTSYRELRRKEEK